MRLKGFRFLALLALALFALAACRAPAQTGAGNTGVTTSEQTGTATATATPEGKPAPGAVTLVLNKSSYGPGETIEVTIKNGLKTEIFAADHRTSCTLVQLQRLESGTWHSEGFCKLETATRFVALAPGSSTLQALAAGKGLNATGPWPAGTYRVAFMYQAGSDEAPASQGLVYSANFVIR
ncbi:MAG TPA: hypothetical protein VH599_11800 [Ktedonobacterales bacterium]|jgi:hypothetical protein